MATTRELINQAEKELHAAKGEICSEADNRLIDVCEILLELIGRLESKRRVAPRTQ